MKRLFFLAFGVAGALLVIYFASLAGFASIFGWVLGFLGLIIGGVAWLLADESDKGPASAQMMVGALLMYMIFGIMHQQWLLAIAMGIFLLLSLRPEWEWAKRKKQRAKNMAR